MPMGTPMATKRARGCTSICVAGWGNHLARTYPEIGLEIKKHLLTLHLGSRFCFIVLRYRGNYSQIVRWRVVSLFLL